MRTRNGLYTLLQVLPSADPGVIEAAYKALMKTYHPDRYAGEDAERKAAEISHAFNVLRDPHRRAAYDDDERAREDRYRVELARAYAEKDGAGDAQRRLWPPVLLEPAPRPGHRLAAWAGAAGALVLAGTVILFARGAPEAPLKADSHISSAPLPATSSTEGQLDPAEAPVPFRDQPVSRDRVQTAVAEFGRVAAAAGLQGASAFSEQCFQTQAQTLDVGDFDFCVAFDHAAGRAELMPRDNMKPGAARRFQPQNQVARHLRAADPMADSFATIELRLFEIRRLADSVLAERSAAPPLPDVASGSASQIQPRRHISRVAPRRPARAQPRHLEQDFLEREGGIY